MGIKDLSPFATLGETIVKINEIIDNVESFDKETLAKLKSRLYFLETIVGQANYAWTEIISTVGVSNTDPVGKKLKNFLNKLKQELLDAIESGGGGGGITPEELEGLLQTSETITEIWDVIKEMQGPEWTNEHSIMDNYKRTVIESITPKNIYTEVIGDEAHVVFSYEDNENISHFILQYWDEDKREWVNYNGTDGIVPK